VVLLDEVESYSRRAWCVLEALTADRIAGTFDVLSGLPENSDPAGSPYRHLSDLLLDLPHVVWRAMLDIEVFGSIGWRQALDLLEIGVTDPNDLPYIYDRLRAIPAPNRLHTLAGDLVTGAFPLPEVEAGHVIVPDDASRPVEVPSATPLGSLPWDDILTLDRRGAIGEAKPPAATAHVPFVRWRPAGDGRPEAHVAIVASCEGEAVLLADWIDGHLGDLEAACGVDVTSRSWVADDVAPVGTIVFGGLRRVSVSAPNWIIVTMAVRRDHCSVTGMLASTARRADRAVAWALVDVPRVEAEHGFPTLDPGVPSPDAGGTRSAPEDDQAARLGGVYRRDLAVFLGGQDV
jgi:hypothetical protein